MADSRNKDVIVVSMTGFVTDCREQHYKQNIQELGWRLAPMLSQETSVLIVNDVSTEKYKIAKTYDPPITCVSAQWLAECSRQHKLLSTTPYHIKQLFLGVAVKIVAFPQEKAIVLHKKLSQNGAQVTIFQHNSELDSLASGQDRTSVIVTSRHNFNKLQHHIDHISCYPIVDLDWVEDSFQSKICKYPYDYAMNQIYISRKEPIDHYPKMKKKLQQRLVSPPLDKFQPKILEHCFVYLSHNVNPELSLLLKKLVMSYGGFYLEELSPIVTHILTEALTEQAYSELRVYGALLQVVRVEWLIDSIYIHKKMREEDYQIRSFKPPGKAQCLHLQQKQNNMHTTNSMSFNSFGMNMTINSIPTLLNNRKSISVMAQTNLKVKFSNNTKEVKVTKRTQSHIFKGQRFYIESTQKKQVELNDLTAKIVKNAGEVFTSRADIKSGHCFYIIKDTHDSLALIQRIKQHTRGKVQLQPASHRWVNECLSKGQFIDLLKTQSYIFKPFNFKTPLHGIHKMVFEVLGVQDTLKLRLKELYNTLGSTRNMANKKEITHCLCGSAFKQLPRYRQLRCQNQNIKYISWRWLLECANNGKLVQIQSYLMEKGGGELQEIENTNMANLQPVEPV